MSKYRIIYTEKRTCETFVEADGRQDAITKFDEFWDGGFEGTVLYDDGELARVEFYPAQPCLHCGNEENGPSDDSPTPDEYCSLRCADRAKGGE